jgi:hypothetical protein
MSAALHLYGLVTRVLADGDVDQEIEERLTPGWVGALVIVGLIVVTVLLWLSMRRQFGKIRFDDESGDESERGDEPRDEAPGRSG